MRYELLKLPKLPRLFGDYPQEPRQPYGSVTAVSAKSDVHTPTDIHIDIIRCVEAQLREALDAARYRAIREMPPAQFAKLYVRTLVTGKDFDAEVDRLIKEKRK